MEIPDRPEDGTAKNKRIIEDARSFGKNTVVWHPVANPERLAPLCQFNKRSSERRLARNVIYLVRML
jgi:hypothetical protein